jgi:hypothetical protein
MCENLRNDWSTCAYHVNEGNDQKRINNNWSLKTKLKIEEKKQLADVIFKEKIILNKQRNAKRYPKH